MIGPSSNIKGILLELFITGSLAWVEATQPKAVSDWYDGNGVESCQEVTVCGLAAVEATQMPDECRIPHSHQSEAAKRREIEAEHLNSDRSDFGGEGFTAQCLDADWDILAWVGGYLG